MEQRVSVVCVSCRRREGPIQSPCRSYKRCVRKEKVRSGIHLKRILVMIILSWRGLLIFRLRTASSEISPTTTGENVEAFMSSIRQFAASNTGNVFAAAEFEQLVHLCDLSSMQLLRTLKTTLDFGGNRLAISEDGTVLAVGAYYTHGIALYRTADNIEVWRRKDIKEVQQVSFCGDGTRVFCCTERKSCQVLNTARGTAFTALSQVKGIWESPFQPVRFLEQTRGYALTTLESPIARIERISFAVLGASFSESSICISEAGGPVRCFDTADGREIWRFEPAKGTHFLHVAFCRESASFVGVSWPYERGGKLLLQQFDRNSGVPKVITHVGPAIEMEFCLNGSRLISNDGSTLDVMNGRIVGKLQFPEVTSPQNRSDHCA